MPTFDLHKNFSYSLISVAPVPAASGTTANVTAGDGALFPVVPFNAVIWPAGANPSAANAEVVRVTSKGTGDNFTFTRTQESSSARTIALGDQIAAAITAKIVTDIEGRLVTAETTIAAGGLTAQARVPGGRLTLTTALAVTTADVTAATTLFYTPMVHNIIGLYSGSAWADFTFPELSIAVPGTTSQMYDVFVFDNAGTRTLELLAWTNDTARATALIRQDGHWVKTGATTRLYVGSFRTTTVAGQTEDSLAKRYVWNYNNRARRLMRVTEATNTWAYSTATYQQANASTLNQLDCVVGIAEVPLSVTVMAFEASSNGVLGSVSIGEDSATVAAAGVVGEALGNATGGTANALYPGVARLEKNPAIGRHFYAWLEKHGASGTGTWYGDNGGTGDTLQSGIVGHIEG